MLFGPYCIIYRSRSIVRGEYIGSSETLFSWDTTISNEGVVSHDGVIDMQDYHVFFGNDGIYEYRGGANISPISDDIYAELFGSQGQVNFLYSDRIIAFHVPELKELWFSYPVFGSAYSKKTARYRIDTGAWTFRTWAHDISGYGSYLRTAGVTWLEVEGTWPEQDWQWTSSKLVTQSPVLILGQDCCHKTVQYDQVAITDDGTDIAWYAITKAFVHPRFKFRVDDFQFRARGTSIKVEYSADGAAWLEYATVSLSDEEMHYTINKQLVTNRIQWRISGATAGFSLDWIGFSYEFESEW
jgi:hypothetical protein